MSLPDTNPPGQSGGINLEGTNIEGDFHAQDWTGRDRYTAGGHLIRAEPGAVVTINEQQRSGPPLQRPALAEYFQGRQAELAELLAALQPDRVHTLVGPGGMGISKM